MVVESGGLIIPISIYMVTAVVLLTMWRLETF